MPLITDSATVQSRIEALSQEAFITIDTEFLREKTYYPKLCLIQVAGEHDAFAMDPLAEGIDLTPFFELLSNPNIVKVFHSCSQDIEILYQHTQSIPTPLFDTQIAAQMLGHGEAVGYGVLVKDICDIELDKTPRHTNWSERPLSKQQIEYAIGDVTYLRDIYRDLTTRLKERKRLEWAQEEMEQLRRVEQYISPPEDAWKRLKVRHGKASFLNCVKALAAWREQKAQDKNLPRQWVMRDDTIMEIAAVMPESSKALHKLRSYKVKNEKTDEHLLQLISNARQAKGEAIQRKKPLPNGAKALMELLKVILKAQCEAHDIAPSVVARTEDLEQIAIDKASDSPAMHGWRYDIFGQYADALKDGKLALTVKNHKIAMIEADHG